MFTQKELNLRQRKWLGLLKDYDMSVLYHPDKDIVVVDDLCHMTMGSISHIDESKKYLVRDVHRFSRLGVRRSRSPIGWFEVGEPSLLGPDFIYKTLEKVHIIRNLLQTSYSPQKFYVDHVLCRSKQKRFGVLRR